ncbi:MULTISPECIES: protein-glutamate O-methyltransferase CheR [Methylobacterium]|uniref:protein-glutamate O-methyltransferase n=2 Tax=Pseudomonadota TaxID=1224 RepID=A0ABQ4SUK6_9HYPH|nr:MULTISPECIES: protein-glutamate O-methyltransferase CheR [Methylobacterium]PIU07341.1 MAG: chemotaxis protein CheR [Methylobacterium sp. CG09_land_8_20_14_0_10_71_15]PIU11960.1 MAG: chemotaxis protein CheR [Methylobacterium sp. CG08_land_8_20_14_0_20_71_15]GBU16154.1 chemotaxis protein methyltransferase CheR [Methylobacterium sp.]GJE05911.1 Chemotaxis protein methyltransferase 1 [Methylobacterium jeotgali]
MTEAEFEFIRIYLKQRSGLSLTGEKHYLIESRLGPVCRRFRIASLTELVTALKASRDAALEKAVVEAMTTNETFFFRDRAPFDLFRDVLLPEAMQRRAAQRRLRIWCAASSTGQEPYSLAMMVQEAAPKLAGWQVDIVATDLSTEVIEKARQGLYSHFEAQRGLPVQLLLKYFAQVGEQWQIAASIRQMVEYRQLNLLNGFEGLGQFDIVFCRNVLIYFDAPTKGDILRRVAAAMNPGASLLLGAAETVIGLTDRLAPHAKHRGLYGHAEAAPAAANASAPAPLWPKVAAAR